MRLFLAAALLLAMAAPAIAQSCSSPAPEPKTSAAPDLPATSQPG